MDGLPPKLPIILNFLCHNTIMAKIDKVSEVAFYPLKGGRRATIDGEVPQALTVGVAGFEVDSVRDRDFVLFDPNENAFVSQRGWGAQGRKVRYPGDRRLATVAVDLRGDHIAISSTAGQLELPTISMAGQQRTLDIFGKELPVIEQGADAKKYFSLLFEREVILVRSDRERSRVLPASYQRDGAFNLVAGADGMPFLLTSNASLAAAHQANGMPPGIIPINRYRGNIVISGDGLGAFGEDFIDGEVPFSIGDISMWAVKACSRCPVPDVDQETGELAGGGLRVLRGRTGQIFTGESGVFFGQNVTHGTMGSISVGDLVEIESMLPTPNIEFTS